MAKYEKIFTGDLKHFMDYLHHAILNSSMSTHFEDGSSFQVGASRVIIRVYERYSMMGSNRVSLNITVAEVDSKIHLSAITSGGSEAVFFKINTVGEENFLHVCREIVENYVKSNQ